MLKNADLSAQNTFLQDDTIFISLTNTTYEIDVLSNDEILTDTFWLYIATEPQNGTLALNQSNEFYTTFSYTSDNANATDYFEYGIEITNPIGEVDVLIASVYILPENNMIDLCEQDCVWPGETNDDNIVNVWDLLPIGFAYNMQGIPREETSIFWQAYEAENWNDTLANGRNLKHLDCNGDGIIDNFDVQAIEQNYSQIVAGKNNKTSDTNASFTLFLDIQNDSLVAGEPVVANVLLGDEFEQAEEVYGLAFSINYPSEIVQDSSVTIDFGETWLGENENTISLSKNLENGTIEAAITRTDLMNQNGYGVLATLQFWVMEDVIIGSGKGENELLELQLDFGNVSIVSANQSEIDVNTVGDILQISTFIDKKEKNYKVNIFPNPTHHIFCVEILDNEEAMTLILSNTLSQNLLIKHLEKYKQKTYFDISSFPKGTYFLQFYQKDKAILTKKIIIQ